MISLWREHDTGGFLYHRNNTVKCGAYLDDVLAIQSNCSKHKPHHLISSLYLLPISQLWEMFMYTVLKGRGDSSSVSAHWLRLKETTTASQWLAGEKL